jgi:hypothetical protein
VVVPQLPHLKQDNNRPSRPAAATGNRWPPNWVACRAYVAPMRSLPSSGGGGPSSSCCDALGRGAPESTNSPRVRVPGADRGNWGEWPRPPSRRNLSGNRLDRDRPGNNGRPARQLEATPDPQAQERAQGGPGRGGSARRGDRVPGGGRGGHPQAPPAARGRHQRGEAARVSQAPRSRPIRRRDVVRPRPDVRVPSNRLADTGSRTARG